MTKFRSKEGFLLKLDEQLMQLSSICGNSPSLHDRVASFGENSRKACRIILEVGDEAGQISNLSDALVEVRTAKNILLGNKRYELASLLEQTLAPQEGLRDAMRVIGNVSRMVDALETKYSDRIMNRRRSAESNSNFEEAETRAYEKVDQPTDKRAYLSEDERTVTAPASISYPAVPLPSPRKKRGWRPSKGQSSFYDQIKRNLS